MKKLLTCAVSLCLSLAMVACGGGGDDQSTSPRLDGPVPTTSTYIAAQGYPGDLWKWTIDRSNSSNITFQATNTAVQPNLTYSGTAQQLPSGFLNSRLRKPTIRM